DGEISILLFNNVDEVILISKAPVNNGNYEIILNYTNIIPDNYVWDISFTSSGYESWEGIKFEVTILPHNYVFEVQINDELQPGEKYIITTFVYYEDNLTDGSLSLNQLYSKGKSGENVGVEGIEVNFETILVYKDGSKIKISKPAITNSKGLAFITISAEETISLQHISEISISIEGHSFGNSNALVLSSSDLPVINTPKQSIEVKLQNTLSDNVILIVIIIALSVLIVFVYLGHKKKEEDHMAKLDMIIQLAHQEIDAMKSLQAIVIQNTTKLNVYEEQLGELDLNSTLIGGMVSAFSTFLNEVGKQELFGFEVMEREGVSITSHQGKISNMIIISTEKLPYTVLDQVKIAQQLVETNYKNYFSTNRRGVLNLTKDQVRPLLDEAEFKLSLLGSYEFQPNNMKKLLMERSISNSMKRNIKSLLDFDEYYHDGRQMSFETIGNYFQDKDMPRKMRSRAIILAYIYKILIPEHQKIDD
ncbi:MAG: hypothetical protein ACW99Q_20065, partial [Candidatus Kariarchaeaceae archaeon]